MSDTLTQCARLWSALQRGERLTKRMVREKYGIENVGGRIDELNDKYNQAIKHDMIPAGVKGALVAEYYISKRKDSGIQYGTCKGRDCGISTFYSINGKCSRCGYKNN